MEREKGLEPSTSTLARLHSTTELLPQIFKRSINQSLFRHLKTGLHQSTLNQRIRRPARHCGVRSGSATRLVEGWSMLLGSHRLLLGSEAHFESSSAQQKKWAEEDSNLQGLPHKLLRLARLPVSPPAPRPPHLAAEVRRAFWRTPLIF